MHHHLKLAGKAGLVQVNSAGTLVSQPGVRPDLRATKIAQSAGVKLGRIRSSRVTENEIISSDYILAMDSSHLAALLKRSPPEHRHKISLLLAYLPDSGMQDIPDPYYGSFAGFIDVYNLIENAVIALIPHLDAGG